ncbi:MAG: transglutaminase-like cysteine peptidase [Proteobacteria bacterium]|nr:transglutaminase-like cysteine peptidase [Pseudomonadota bacterium]
MLYAKPHPPQEIPSHAGLKDSFFRAMARNFKSYKLGDLLILRGLISSVQLEAALFEQRETREQLGKILIRQGAISAVQLYRKLVEQWCLKASAAGITLIMQSVTPAIAYAGDLTGSSGTLSSQFTLAAASSSSVFRDIKYPALFGSREIKSDDISPFKKWTSVMKRFEEQMKTVSATSPRVMMWKAEIQRLKYKSPREQVEGVNAFLNRVPYIEDLENYGVTDYWATPIEFLTRGGDCEDFAIAKYASLRALGFSDQQLRIAIVQDQVKNIPHAILVVYSDNGNFVLDNQNKRVELITRVTRYKPIFSINSTSWWLHRA